VREATSGAHLPQSPQRPFAENLLTNDAFDWQLANWQTGKMANWQWQTGDWQSGNWILRACAAGHSVGNL